MKQLTENQQQTIKQNNAKLNTLRQYQTINTNMKTKLTEH